MKIDLKGVEVADEKLSSNQLNKEEHICVAHPLPFIL